MTKVWDPNGNIFSEDYIFLSENIVLNKKTADIIQVTQDDIVTSIAKYEDNINDISGVNEEIEIVNGVDTKKINFNVVDVDGSVPIVNGFLIEVYLSGTDANKPGLLTKLYQDDIVDPITNKIIQRGFGSYFNLEVDK